jgi:hypothetical protein
MKHTPGPWKVYHEVFRAELSNMKIIEIQDEHGKSIIFWTGFDSANQAEKEKLANARLIAAAPELLKVCEYMAQKAFMRKWDGDEKAFDMLEKALKKAGSEVAP